MLVAFVILVVMAIKEAAVLPPNVLFWLWMAIAWFIAGLVTWGVLEVRRALKG